MLFALTSQYVFEKFTDCLRIIKNNRNVVFLLFLIFDVL